MISFRIVVQKTQQVEESFLGTVIGGVLVSGLVVAISKYIIVVFLCQLTKQCPVPLFDAIDQFIVLQSVSFPL